MRRTQIQLDEPTYQLLRKQAFERGVSMATLLREAVGQYLVPKRKQFRIEELTFIGSGYSDQGDLAPISERHDEALAEDLERELAEKGREYSETHPE